MTKAIVSGTIYAEDPIFSPNGYAKRVFGSLAYSMKKEVTGNKMEFTLPSVSVSGTNMDATLIEEVVAKMPEDYTGNITFKVTYV